ncbi:MAG: M48 family metallopeptidase [Planctomycetota bacterium]|jgi:Zn-dependent protease with chaperone function
MGILILTILGLMVAVVYPRGPVNAKIYYDSTFLFLVSFIGFSVFLAMILVQWALKSFRRIGYRPNSLALLLDPDSAEKAAEHVRMYRLFVLLRRLYWVVIIAGYAIAIFTFHLPRVIEHPDFFGLGVNTFTKALELAPFFLIVILALTLFFLVEQAFSLRKSNLSGYLLYHIRWMLIVIFPLACFGLMSDAVRHYIFDYEPFIYRYPAANVIGSFILFAFLFTLFPFVPRLIFRSETIGESPLRKRIEDLAERMGVSYRDVRIWHTGMSGFATAFVAGPISLTRYVFFSDTLASGMSEEEVEAVAAHEFAHAKRNHLFLYLGLIFGLAAATTPIVDSGELLVALRIPGEFVTKAWVILQLLTMAGILVIFAYLAKRFELEADLLGARSCGEYSRFIIMLQKLAMLNGMPLNSWSPVHFSIAKRMEMLGIFQENPSEAEKFLKFIKRARMFIGIIVILGVIVLGFMGYSDLTAPKSELLKRDYSYAMNTENYAGAIEILDELAPYASAENVAREYFELAKRLGPDGSYRAIRKATQLDPENAKYRMLLEEIERAAAPPERETDKEKLRN